MDQWIEIRRRVSSGELSKWRVSSMTIHWDTLQKILSHSEPPGYRLTKQRPSKLEPFVPFIHELLESDRTVHRKQRHTAQRGDSLRAAETAVEFVNQSKPLVERATVPANGLGSESVRMSQQNSRWKADSGL